MRQKIIPYLSLLIIPLLLCIIHIYFFITVDNPVYVINTDPDYAYLLSSVNLDNLGVSRMVLHPGTTFQVLAHLVMKTAYFFSPGEKDTFQVSVLTNAIYYLTVLQGTFSLLNIILVLALGIAAYRFTKNIYAGLLIQLTPFFSSQVLIFGFRKVTADVLLVSVSLLLNIILVKWLHDCSHNCCHSLPERTIYKYAVGLGIISGFALATKVTFFVVLVLPIIILSSIRSRLIYFIATIAGVLIFTLPIISQYPIFYRFIAQVFTHKGIYGHGASAVMDMREYSANLGKLLIENIPFILLLVTGIFFLIIAYIQRRLKELPDSILNDFSTRVLTAILLSQILGIIVVARHFKSKYLLPVLCLSPLLLYLLYFAREEAEPGKILPAAPRKQLKVAVVCFIIFSFVYTLYGLSQHHQSQSLRLQEAAAINEKLKGEYKNYCIIYYYNAPSEIFGLEFGHQWTPAFQEALLKIFGNHFFYNLNNRSFYSWSGKKISIEELKNRYNGRIVLFGNPFPRLLEKQNIQLPEFPIKDVFSGQFYTLYILEII